MAYAVRFEEVTKRYSRGGARYPSLRNELADTVRRLRACLRSEPTEPRGTLALDRVSFEVKEGEAFAIIGPNGAGKTTALKLVSRISYPTKGRVLVRGRVAALIEVGSGVHPELTARENVWLYGQILGMPKSEIRRRFDEIVEFAELSHAIDRPVKLYSSGMQLRLGFAVASHLDPDVFVVDEALAVGDAGFQAKCVERMAKLVAEGRTLLLVSHNLYAVETTCKRGVYVRHGTVQCEGEVRDCLGVYLNQTMQQVDDNGAVTLSRRLKARFWCRGFNGGPRTTTGAPLDVYCEYDCESPGTEVFFHYGITDGRGGNLLLLSQLVEGLPPLRLARRGVVKCRVKALNLMPRVYELWGQIRVTHGWGDLIDWQPLARFVVEGGPDSGKSLSHAWLDGPVRVPATFEHDC